MKRHFLIGLTFTLLNFFCVNSFAQDSGKGQGMPPLPWNSACDTIELLEFSSSQREIFKRIEAQHKGRILAYKQNLMIKRLELRDQLRSEDVSEASIRKKSEELEEARRLLYWKMIDYQLQIRRILKPEQRKHWCTMVGEPVSRGGWRGGSWCR